MYHQQHAATILYQPPNGFSQNSCTFIHNISTYELLYRDCPKLHESSDVDDDHDDDDDESSDVDNVDDDHDDDDDEEEEEEEEEEDGRDE